MSAIDSLLGYCYRAPAIYCIVPSPRTFIAAYQKHFHWPDEKRNLKQNTCPAGGSPAVQATFREDLLTTPRKNYLKKKKKSDAPSLSK